MPFVDRGAQCRQALGGGGQLQIGAADDVSEIQQHLGDAAHADSADPREMQVLPLKKHYLLVLFRLSPRVSIKIVSDSGTRHLFEHIGGAARGAGVRELARGAAHALQNTRARPPIRRPY